MKTLDPVQFKIRKETILEHARHLFATQGFSDTSMDDIARNSHIQKASVYHYFKSKHQVLQEMVDLGVQRWSARLQDYAAGRDLRDTLTRIATTFLDDMQDPARREFFKIIHFESHKDPSIQQAMKNSPEQNREAFYAVFAKHLPKLSRVQIAMFITQFMGALIYFATVSRLRDENTCLEKFSDADYIQSLVALCARNWDKK